MISYRVFSPDGTMTCVGENDRATIRWVYCRDGRPGWRFVLSSIEPKRVPSSPRKDCAFCGPDIDHAAVEAAFRKAVSE